MFVEHKEASEVTEAPAKRLKLSEAIRAGMDEIKETKMVYLNLADMCGCALGTAAFALGYRGDNEGCDYWLMEQFPNIEPEFFKTLSDHHHYGRMTREQIADYLERNGY